MPGCLGSIGNFKNKFSDPIEQGQRHSVTKSALATGRKTVRALVRKISHLFLRRTKALIKEQLPKKDDRVRLVILMAVCSLENSQSAWQYSVIIIFRWRSVMSKSNPQRHSVLCFLLGGVLLSDRLSADCVSDGVGHWRCDVNSEVFREMSLSKWTHPRTLLLWSEFPAFTIVCLCRVSAGS